MGAKKAGHTILQMTRECNLGEVHRLFACTARARPRVKYHLKATRNPRPAARLTNVTVEIP